VHGFSRDARYTKDNDDKYADTEQANVEIKYDVYLQGLQVEVLLHKTFLHVLSNQH
jgi:hypothetical protein